MTNGKKKLLGLIFLATIFCLIILYILYNKHKESYYFSNDSAEAVKKGSLIKKIDNYTLKCVDKKLVKEIWLEKASNTKYLFSSEYAYFDSYSLQIKVENKNYFRDDNSIYYYINNDTLMINNFIGRNQNGFYILLNKQIIDNKRDTIHIRSNKSCLEIKIPMK